MAKARAKATPKAPAIRPGRREIVTVPLSHGGPDEGYLLDLAGKADSGDASRGHVRGGQFSDSFMMATNGGSTYEDLLRPGARPVATPPIVTAAAAMTIEPRVSRRRTNLRTPGGLHNVIGHSDDRVEITDTSRIPARSVAQLRIQTGTGEERCGTAWLIGPRTLATAAHNLISPDAGVTVSIMAGLSFDGHTARGGWHKVVDNAFRQTWRDDPSANVDDYAVLKIADPTVGNKLGWFGYANYEDEKFPNMILNIFGYPLDEDTKHPGSMYASAGRIVRTTATHLFYDCDAGGGMSGGPVVARFGEKRIAVGIHVAAGDSTSNIATRITASAYSLFEQHKNW